MEEKESNCPLKKTIGIFLIISVFFILLINIACFIVLLLKVNRENEVSLIWSLTAVTIVLISCVTITICHLIKVNAKKEVELKESKTNEDLISAYKEVFEKDKSKIYIQKKVKK